MTDTDGSAIIVPMTDPPVWAWSPPRCEKCEQAGTSDNDVIEVLGSHVHRHDCPESL